MLGPSRESPIPSKRASHLEKDLQEQDLWGRLLEKGKGGREAKGLLGRYFLARELGGREPLAACPLQRDTRSPTEGSDQHRSHTEGTEGTICHAYLSVKAQYQNLMIHVSLRPVLLFSCLNMREKESGGRGERRRGVSGPGPPWPADFPAEV